jgi:predicted ATP-dependent endonuclease of OLD family
MYIKNITIKGFRNFGENVVEFHEGINVLIGHNNAGKSVIDNESNNKETFSFSN